MSVDIHRNSACGPAVAPIQHTKKFFKISSVPLASVSPKSFNRDMRKAIVIVLFVRRSDERCRSSLAVFFQNLHLFEEKINNKLQYNDLQCPGDVKFRIKLLKMDK